MPETEGYPAMWPVAGALILAGAVALYLAGRADPPEDEPDHAD
jgi:hypothetical protein